MRTSNRFTILAGILLTLAFGGPMLAADKGKITAIINDDKGAPIQGAKVTLSRKGSPTKTEQVSDGQGQVSFLIKDVTHEYDLRIEKEGYDSAGLPVKAKASEEVRVAIGLVPAALNQAVRDYNEGVNSLEAGNAGAALASLEKAITLNPKLPEAHAALAKVHLQQKSYVAAVAAANQFLALRPNDPRGLRLLYDAQKGAGEDERARETLVALVAAEPKSNAAAVLCYNEGIRLTNAGKPEEAAVYFEMVVQIAPGDSKFAKAHFFVGSAYARDETRKEAAKRELNTFLEMAPADPQAAAAKELLEHLSSSQ